MAKEPVRITIEDVLDCLANGYTRTTSDPRYQGEGKSIEEKYGLNKTQVFELFKHDKLKGRKTILKAAPAFIIVDDEGDAVEDTPEAEAENSPDITDSTDTTDTTDSDEGNATDEEEDTDSEETVNEDTEEESPSWM